MAPQPVRDYRREVLGLLALALAREIEEQENPSRGLEAGWDSLKHVELMFLVEDHFGVRFTEREMAEIEDLRGIVRVLEARLAAQPGD